MTITKLPDSIMSRVFIVAEAASVKDDDFAAKLHDLMHECCVQQSNQDYSTAKSITKAQRHKLIVPELPNYKEPPA